MLLKIETAESRGKFILYHEIIVGYCMKFLFYRFRLRKQDHHGIAGVFLEDLYHVTGIQAVAKVIIDENGVII